VLLAIDVHPAYVRRRYVKKFACSIAKKTCSEISIVFKESVEHG